MTTANEFFDMNAAPLRIGAVRLKVRDLDRVATFYTSVLGLAPIEITSGRVTVGTDIAPQNWIVSAEATIHLRRQ